MSSRKERDERVNQLRERIVEVVKENGQLTSHQIAKHLGMLTARVSSCCAGLARNGFLKEGERVLAELKYTNINEDRLYTRTWVLGDNKNKISTEFKTARSLAKKNKRVSNDYRPVTTNKFDPMNGIDQDDLDWMQYYREQNRLRCHRLGTQIIHDSLTSVG